MWRMAGVMVAGSAVTYAVGVPISRWPRTCRLSQAVALGLTPYLIGDALKAVLAMGVLPVAWKLARRRG